ncbi:Tda2p SCDLUD_000329 [Saccharomycodes ludwigii]|uniref:Tda2p n=1 Tax=Saccharomycodes ludwigii TaxID=36035 RepID=UPI001E85B56C|nr:hypothetical protein SCDLUD_000329 [Saccharomycodes ludwigii]KAH3902741.1 hypothetical protein SCDLUD_000329 [Saccharomycodes ludwigii]
MSAKIINEQIHTEEIPISIDKLRSLITENFKNTQDVQGSISTLINELNNASSLHKYIVTCTSIKQEKVNNNTENFTISNKIGTSWDKNKDGLFNCKIKDTNGDLFLITVVWITIMQNH